MHNRSTTEYCKHGNCCTSINKQTDQLPNTASRHSNTTVIIYHYILAAYRYNLDEMHLELEAISGQQLELPQPDEQVGACGDEDAARVTHLLLSRHHLRQRLQEVHAAVVRLQRVRHVKTLRLQQLNLTHS